MSAETDTQRPNIIWIMADDLSWADSGCYGQQMIRTPNIDRLAAEGMRFTSCYSGSTVCAPSRSSLMQGLHQGHATVRGNSAPGGYRHSLQPEDITVAEVLRQAGYATGLFGKWGLALYDQPGIPRNKGFDEFFGYLNQRHAHNYYPPYLWRNEHRVFFPQHEGHEHREPDQYDARGRIIPNRMEEPAAAQHSFDVYARASEQWLQAHHEEPFFLYLAYTLPHMVLEVPELGPYTDEDWPLPHRIYAAMVTHLDSAVGRIMELLRRLGIDENTLVFFTSDNGYSHAGLKVEPTLDEFFDHRGPFKGRKGNLHQGGLRVPTIARWPGVIEPGQTCNEPWAYWDLMPTATELAGVECPRTDGVSIVPMLTGDSANRPEREYLYWEYHDEQSVRLGEYWAWRAHPDQPVEIYHADEDPQQERDLAPEMPDLVARIEQIMAEAHEPNLYFPAPGQTREDWERALAEAEIELPENIDR